MSALRHVGCNYASDTAAVQPFDVHARHFLLRSKNQLPSHLHLSPRLRPSAEAKSSKFFGWGFPVSASTRQ